MEVDLARAVSEEVPSSQRAEPTSEPMDLTAEPAAKSVTARTALDAYVGQPEGRQSDTPVWVGAAAVVLVAVLAVAILRMWHDGKLRERSASTLDPRRRIHQLPKWPSRQLQRKYKL